MWIFLKKNEIDNGGILDTDEVLNENGNWTKAYNTFAHGYCRKSGYPIRRKISKEEERAMKAVGGDVK